MMLRQSRDREQGYEMFCSSFDGSFIVAKDWPLLLFRLRSRGFVRLRCFGASFCQPCSLARADWGAGNGIRAAWMERCGGGVVQGGGGRIRVLGPTIEWFEM